MPKPKLRPLQKLRQKAANDYILSGTKPGSAYALLQEKNRELIHGKRLREDDNGEDEQEAVTQHVSKKSKPAAKKKQVKPKPRKRAKKTSETIVENWRPAGGESIITGRGKKKVQATSTLGIARVSTWRLDAFTTAVKALIEPHGEIEDVSTSELVHGGESVTDVFIKFVDESLAEAVKEKIDGEILEGRKLEVEFA